MNNKLLSVVLVVGIASTGFAGISAANSGKVLSEEKSEMRELFEKSKAGETLTADEQAVLDAVKAARGERGAKHGGKRKGGGNLTDEEKAFLESMSDDEKKTFFDAKKQEMKAQKQAGKAVIDKLIAGETLTAAEEATRLEMIAKMEEKSSSGKSKGGSEIIGKILAGDELTTDEETELAQMQAKHAEREAQRAILEPIKAKLDAGEALTDEEQTLLDEHKSERKGKGHGKRGGHGKGQRGEK